MSRMRFATQAATATYRSARSAYRHRAGQQDSSLWCRSFSISSSSRMADTPPPPTPQVAAKTEADAEAIRASLKKLLVPSAGGDAAGRWLLTRSGEGIERSFQFKNFTKTWDFMTSVALQCKLKNHHPEWSNVYNTTFVRWTTHNPKGLTKKDVQLAAVCDDLARDFGEVVKEDELEQEAAPACGLVGLADQAAGVSGGDCCTPKGGPKA